MRLSPKADDIWFWAMAVLNGTQFVVVPDGYRTPKLIDDNDMSGGTCLWQENCNGGNDRQLKAVIKHYPELQEWVRNQSA